MNSLNVDELRAAAQAARDRQTGEPRSSRRPSVAGHMLHWTHPEALADAVFGFLSSVDSFTMPAR